MILSSLLRAYIAQNNLSIRAVAAQIGIKHNNLWRIIHGENTRADNVLKILIWMLSDSQDQMALTDQRALNEPESEVTIAR